MRTDNAFLSALSIKTAPLALNWQETGALSEGTNGKREQHSDQRSLNTTLPVGPYLQYPRNLDHHSEMRP